MIVRSQSRPGRGRPRPGHDRSDHGGDGTVHHRRSGDDDVGRPGGPGDHVDDQSGPRAGRSAQLARSTSLCSRAAADSKRRARFDVARARPV